MWYKQKIDVNKTLRKTVHCKLKEVIMANVKETVRANLVKLRKERKMTQMELAEKIGYSDKAISRWETGEVNPDIETLDKLADLYEVDISVFFAEYNAKEYKAKMFKETQMGRKIAVWILMVVALWYIGIMIFIYSSTFKMDESRSWLIFIWLLPITFVLCALFNVKWGNSVLGIIFASLICWTLLTAIYLQFLAYNVYLLFISGLPIQIAILLLAYMRTKKE